MNIMMNFKMENLAQVYCAQYGEDQMKGMLVKPKFLVPKFAGSNPAEAVGFSGRKILSAPSFGGEVEPSVPRRSFVACKKSLQLQWKWQL
jgi:hypothetical protein